jgi:hypothetical protein
MEIEPNYQPEPLPPVCLEEIHKSVLELNGGKRDEFFKLAVCYMAYVMIGHRASSVKAFTGLSRRIILKVHAYLADQLNQEGQLIWNADLFDEKKSNIALCLEVMCIQGEIVKVKEKSDKPIEHLESDPEKIGGYHLKQEQLLSLEKLFVDGFTIREIQRRTGIHTNTIMKYRRIFMRKNGNIKCSCGQPVNHRSFCTWRMQFYPRRNQWLVDKGWAYKK